MKQKDKHVAIDKAYRKKYMRRNLPRFSRFNISGLFPTDKDTSPHFFESLNESNFAQVFELDSNIKFVRSQPFSINYTDDGKKRLYTPDFSITDCFGGICIVEVKAGEAIDNEAKRLHKLIEEEFEKLGFEFVVMTEKDLPSRTTLSNLNMIMRNAHAVGSVDDEVINYLLDVLPREFSLQSALAICDSLNLDRDLIFYFIFKDYMKIDVSSDICNETMITSNVFEEAK
ncbi:TnsA endonuclease N-terminal domain-containing protein [Pseudoalteromonas sp. SR41-4]|uniref:TnsA endonuclease N-terminal domain-containing protein n=1 Tax=Pseudoalteromonas sp. SR41-4 TaxID=2760950 RepID=UPI001600F373|nr:TnsA endonuclease N-terminal domain-containing protein [Pseudoalteromonas sp. SR41-4]MBB1291608.1 hypothetical protein [Pseudoalteromonas sp. SR41-4]